MTFLEWCLDAPEDDTLMEVKVYSSKGKVIKRYSPLQPVRYCDMERLKPLELISEPELTGDIWRVALRA